MSTKPYTAEYVTLTSDDMSGRTVLKTATGAFGTRYTLVHATAGYECAGSAARYTDEQWGCLGAGRMGNFGQWYKTENEAAKHFDRVTTPIINIPA